MKRQIISLTAANASLLIVLVAMSFAEDRRAIEQNDQAFSIVVMDPLSAPLSCPCVEGYAQRKYENLGKYIETKLGRPVRVTFANALSEALDGDANGRVDLIIGKDSVVRADCKEARIKATRLAALTDKEGNTTQTGLIVVAADDPAKAVSDLVDYRILFGPANCEEKYNAPLALLKKAGVARPERIETSQACSDGACTVVELGSGGRSAAVISSYAAPLLEGCGTINKGDLRVVGTTEPVPFIAAFVTDSLSAAEQKTLLSALLAVSDHPKLCRHLESMDGFVAVDDKSRRGVTPHSAEAQPASTDSKKK